MIDTDVKKDDGLTLVYEAVYKLEDIRNYIEDSCLSDCCFFLKEGDDVEKICRSFLELLEEDDLDFEETTTLGVAASMLYFIDDNPATSEWRLHLLHEAFGSLKTLDSQDIHEATKRLYEGLKIGTISHVFNIISTCNELSAINETGRAIAICMMWAIMCEITEIDFETYSFREFPQLIVMLSYIDDDLLQMEESTQLIYILVQCIGFLTNTIVLGKNDALKKAGYSSYFEYSLNDIMELIDWSENLCNILTVSVVKTNNYWDLRMTIIEFVHLNISTVLQENISEIEVI